jgi:hypothetical protein
VNFPSGTSSTIEVEAALNCFVSLLTLLAPRANAGLVAAGAEIKPKLCRRLMGCWLRQRAESQERVVELVSSGILGAVEARLRQIRVKIVRQHVDCPMRTLAILGMLHRCYMKQTC